jgi:hypothetical protein
VSRDAFARDVIRNLLGLSVCVVVFAACDREQERPRSAGGAGSGSEPVVGGACTYEDVTFRAVVDSVLRVGPALLVHALDTVDVAGDLCRSAGEDGVARWRVPVPASGPEVRPGDTLEITGRVIATGTCTPCALRSRHIEVR